MEFKNEMNKVIAIKEAGDAFSLKLVELPVPTPQEDEILIEQLYAAVNYGDAIRRRRGLFSLNELGYFIPGFEGVGFIKVVGKNVKEFSVGERVCYLSENGGGYSKYICISKKVVYRVPDFIDDKVASVISCVGSTAICLTSIANIKKGQFVLVHGASGGVGLILVQICNELGANVIALVSNKEKMDFVSQFNPHSILLGNDENLTNKINSITSGQGVSSIFDCVGNTVVEINLSTLKKEGKIIYYGSTSGHPNYNGMQILMNSITFQGFNIFNKIKIKSEWELELAKLFTLINEKKVNIHIENIFPLKDAYKSHLLLEGRNIKGKVILECI